MKNAANSKRLTPKQQREFMEVAENWGEVFVLYFSYTYLETAGLVQEADADQITNYYAQIEARVQHLTGKIKEAVDARDFATARTLSHEAGDAMDDLASRKDDAHRLVILSASGRELFAKLAAKRAAQEVA